jgi:hypothetical protein
MQLLVIDIIDGNTKVALSGTGICMNQSDLCGQAKLYLAEDFNIPAIGIKLNGGKPMILLIFYFLKMALKTTHLCNLYLS